MVTCVGKLSREGFVTCIKGATKSTFALLRSLLCDRFPKCVTDADTGLDRKIGLTEIHAMADVAVNLSRCFGVAPTAEFVGAPGERSRARQALFARVHTEFQQFRIL